MVLTGKPNNTCTVGWSTWSFTMARYEISVLTERFKSIGIDHHWIPYSSTPIKKRGLWEIHPTGLDFPSKWEIVMLVLIQTETSY